MKQFFFITTLFFIALGLSQNILAQTQNRPPIKPQLMQGVSEQETSNNEYNNIYAGYYLAAYFAQNMHDWENAKRFIDKLLEANITIDNILQRAMILSMGAGDAQSAIDIAKRIKKQNPDISSTIIDIFLFAEAFKIKDYENAENIINSMPNDATSVFIIPFIKGWLYAAQDKINIKDLNDSTIQIYHAILISEFLNDYKEIEKIIDSSLKVDVINIIEIEKIADLYAHVGIKDKAIKLYKKILKEIPNFGNIEDKIANLEQGEIEPFFKKIKTADEGMARAFYDIANILYNEQNDESARIFANVALYIEPNLNIAKFLLADISKEHNLYDKAISYYNSIDKNDEDYVSAQYKIVDIYEETKQFDKAIQLLNNLPKNVDTLIKIGDFHRSQGNFGLALEAYDKAIEKLGGKVTKDYWHLHYVRGIAYEQLDDWEKAEKELKAALEFQPDHPYILNYLGYTWADKGVNLQEALKMIRRAVDLRPFDGYITDSLGWVLYRMKNYEDAVSVLEEAIAILPYDPTVNDHLGDAYWQVGRKLEAKFQWKRAVENSDDYKQIKEIEKKLINGLE